MTWYDTAHTQNGQGNAREMHVALSKLSL